MENNNLSNYEKQLKKMRDRKKVICPLCKAEVKTLKPHFETRKCKLISTYNSTISFSSPS